MNKHKKIRFLSNNLQLKRRNQRKDRNKIMKISMGQI